MTSNQKFGFQKLVIDKIANSGYKEVWHTVKHSGSNCTFLLNTSDDTDSTASETKPEYDSSNYYDDLSDNEDDEMDEVFQGIPLKGNDTSRMEKAVGRTYNRISVVVIVPTPCKTKTIIILTVVTPYVDSYQYPTVVL